MAEADATTTELEAIRAVVSTIEWTQRAELVMDLFAANAIWTTSSGVRLIGREQIREFTERVLPGAMSQLKGTRYEVSHVEFLRADVAAVQVRQMYAGNDGVPLTTDAEGAPLYVMTKDDGRWRLAACQNTAVA
jgi:uncharacterized protein (TIGR02246 family)